MKTTSTWTLVLALSALLSTTACDDPPPPTAPPAPPTAAKTASASASPSATASASAKAKVKGEEVSYAAGGVTLKGYLAHPEEADGKRPGVLIVHEWWGHNDYVRKRARMIAELGYTALALDMYGDGKNTTHPKDAEKFMKEVFANMPAGKQRFEAARKLLEDHPSTDPAKTAAIGYCFGGAVVLHMARAGLDLAGVASFHGNLSTQKPAEKGAIKAKVLVLHGNDDPMAPAEQVEAFKKEMSEAEADMKFIGYPGATHAFTNPGATAIGKEHKLPLAYNEDADKKSWSELRQFLKKVFGA